MVILCSHKKTKHKTLGKVTSPVVSALRRLRQEERDLSSQPAHVTTHGNKTNKIKQLLLSLGHYFTAIPDGVSNLHLRFELLVLLDSQCSVDLG